MVNYLVGPRHDLYFALWQNLETPFNVKSGLPKTHHPNLYSIFKDHVGILVDSCTESRKNGVVMPIYPVEKLRAMFLRQLVMAKSIPRHINFFGNLVFLLHIRLSSLLPLSLRPSLPPSFRPSLPRFLLLPPPSAPHLPFLLHEKLIFWTHFCYTT